MWPCFGGRAPVLRCLNNAFSAPYIWMVLACMVASRLSEPASRNNLLPMVAPATATRFGQYFLVIISKYCSSLSRSSYMVLMSLARPNISSTSFAGKSAPMVTRSCNVACCSARVFFSMRLVNASLSFMLLENSGEYSSYHSLNRLTSVFAVLSTSSMLLMACMMRLSSFTELAIACFVMVKAFARNSCQFIRVMNGLVYIKVVLE